MLANNYHSSSLDHVACLEITSRINDHIINKQLPRSILVPPKDANVVPSSVIIASKRDVSEDENKIYNTFNFKTYTSKQRDCAGKYLLKSCSVINCPKELRRMINTSLDLKSQNFTKVVTH